MTTAPPAPTPEIKAAPSPVLRAKLESLGRRHLSVAALTGLAMLLVVAIEMLALAMFLDWWLDLPRGVRLGLLIVQAAVLTYILTRMVLAPVLHRPDEDELALMVEKAIPTFRSRLIASQQLARPGAVPPGASTSMVGALVEETERFAAPMDFTRIVPTDKLKKFGLLAIIVPGIAVLGFIAGRNVCTDLLKRAFLSNIPVPRKTRVLVPEGDKRIGIGDNVRLEAQVQGVVPSSGKVMLSFRTRRPQEFNLEQNRDDRFQFGRTIDNVQESFTYRFRLGDGLSPTHTVTAIPRPTVGSIECEQHPPAYSRSPVAKRSLGDLTLLAGSVLQLKATATKDITNAFLRLAGLGLEAPLQVNPQNPRELLGKFSVPARGLNGFSIQMTDTDGMESRDSAVYRVDILPDKAPTVRILYPDRKEELITRQATMLVSFEAADDFELAKVQLKYKVDMIDDGAERSIELDLGEERPQRLRRRFEWRIGDFRPLLSEGATIEYWIEVTDNNDATGPGIAVSDHQLAKIVSEAEKRADLLNRAGDFLGSISDVANDQEKLNRNLGTIIREKAGLR
jgi:hypothetical protein